MISVADTLAAPSPELVLPIVLDHPVELLKGWTLKRARGISDPLLRSTAWGLIEAFEVLTAEPLPGLRVRQLEEGEAEEQDSSIIDTLLHQVRRNRDYIQGSAGRTLSQALNVRDPALAETYGKAVATALDYLNELEKVLVLYGGGADEDAHVALDLIPPAKGGAGPQPSVKFEL